MLRLTCKATYISSSTSPEPSHPHTLGLAITNEIGLLMTRSNRHDWDRTGSFMIKLRERVAAIHPWLEDYCNPPLSLDSQFHTFFFFLTFSGFFLGIFFEIIVNLFRFCGLYYCYGKFCVHNIFIFFTSQTQHLQEQILENKLFSLQYF